MKKNIILSGVLLISGFAFSQVGVNTATPQATFDIVGMSTDSTKTDGLIAPRLKGSELKTKDGLYSAAQTGAIVYVTEALTSTGTTAKTANVTTAGYFYFDGTLWQKLAYGTFTETDGVIGNEVLNATANGGLVRAGSGTAASPYTLGLTSGTANGQIMTWNGTTWSPAAVNLTEVDGVVGNEVLNATANGGLTRAGSGTAASPYTLGLTSGTANGQIMTWNGTTWSPAAVNLTEVDGVVGNEVLNATANGGLTRAGSGTAASPYTLGLTSGTANGQIMTWNGTTWSPAAVNLTEVDGVVGNEVLNATANGGLTRAGSGTAASPYTLGLTSGSANGQVMTWNGTAWGSANALNIYNANGTLTTDRTLSFGGRALTFQGSGQQTVWGSTGTLYQYGITSYANMILNAADNNGNGIPARMHFQIYPEQPAQIIADNDATALNLSTHQTTVAAPINFATSPGSNANGVARAQIDGDGKFNINNTLSVGYTSQQTFASNQKLKVNGSIATSTTTYPDYVFEDYYNKSSVIKPAYKFSSLYDTEKFIKENRHLPGVTSIKELEKTAEGYSFNISDLSVQSLEKIEELYLHTIEQQKQIDEQKNNIVSLLKITEKLQAEIDVLKKQ
ncbi:hypothetical protein DRF65_04480 [Chryseobacterium pennae]|uniref:Peptidase S74 domain-containing protein n=1 Tax=Chryseobacterium pennae TaxID=2258962 RepID=A0A3D9CDV8_9FLAO|nr:hypothetical protein [Chryseobacterium pennae]REC63959.1 hypothetical protein DRF65_04480 [Chryseobacterium pennae]